METGDRFAKMKYAMNTRMFLLIAGVLLVFNAVTSTIPYGMRLFAAAQLVSEYDSSGAENQVAEIAGTENTGTGSAVEEVVGTESAGTGSAATEAAGAASAAEEIAGTESAVTGSAAEEVVGTDSAASETAPQEIDVAALKSDMDKLGVSVSDFRRVGVLNIVMAIIRAAIGLLCVVFCNRVDKSRVTFIAAVTLAVCEAIFAVLMYFNRFLGLGSLLYAVLITGVLLVGAIRMRKIARENPDQKLAMETVRRPAAGERVEAPKKSIKERAMMSSAPQKEAAESSKMRDEAAESGESNDDATENTEPHDGVEE